MLKQLITGMLLSAVPMTCALYAENAGKSLEFKEINARRCCETIRPIPQDPVVAFEPEVAYFYSPTVNINVSSRAPGNTIFDNQAVTWIPNKFTIKSSNINVGDPLNPSSFNDQRIYFQRSGIYLLSYTIVANSADQALPPANYVTTALFINDAEVAGSRYTQYGNLDLLVEPTLESRELVGQVIAYVPAGGSLELRNVSGFPISLGSTGQDVEFSISIEKVADIL